MSENLRIAFISSEAAPFSKTGGLADVSGALPKALSAIGHDVTLIIPMHRGTPLDAVKATKLKFKVPVGRELVEARVYSAALPDSSTRVLLIDEPYYFDRPGLYQEKGKDYEDNCARFSFFSRAALMCLSHMVLRPHVIHVNDWQAALIPAMLKLDAEVDPTLAEASTVLTIHNLAFQGQFWHYDLPLTGLEWKDFTWQGLEHFGHLNCLKAGIVYADWVTTVSPTYAREIQGSAAGCGLESVLQTRAGNLTGILNGIDPVEWNPATDSLIPAQFTSSTIHDGKAACKAALQERYGLPKDADIPLIGMVTRLTDQKGLDLLAGCAEQLVGLDVQLVFLGTGDAHYESMLRDLAQAHPHRFGVEVGFNESLAHQVIAGSDFYLMPSRFEPCGLTQMYSLAYGTIPIVRPVGGLADSVKDLATEGGTGLWISDHTSEALFESIVRASDLYGSNAAGLYDVQRRVMDTDFSWTNSASEYEAIYRQLQTKSKAQTATP